MSFVENRSSAWRVCVVPFCCPFCDTMVDGNNVEHADRHGLTVRLICFGCHREVLLVQFVRGDRDDEE
jgi:hypothetical protein